MTNITALLRQHPVLTFFVLTFVLSWGGVLILVAPVGFPGSTEHAKFPLALVANEAGPLLAGILLTALIGGWAGLRALLSSALRWRVGVRWYAAAILAAPLLVLPVLFALSIISPVFLPGLFTTADKPSLLLIGLMAGLLAGLFEEPGWTGFAVPELRQRRGVLTTGLVVGLMWGVWHFFLTAWGSGDPSGAFSPALFLPPCAFYVGVLPAFRVLMVWVYDRTESLLIAMLMHLSLTACTLFILAPAASGASLALYYGVLTALTWVVVWAIAAVNRGHLSRPGKPPIGTASPQFRPL